jgi:chromosome segregation ATPase
MDYEKELTQLKDNIENAKKLKYKAEIRLEQLKEQENEIIRELETMGIKPENIETEIETLKIDIEKLLKEAKEMLPEDILKKQDIR